jgi:hypothetical protein
MVTKLVNRPLGIGNAYVPNKKEWIAAAIGAIGSLASSFIGGAASSSAAEAAERRQKQQEAKENAWYTRRYNEDYVDTAAGQNLVRRAKEFAKSQWKKASGAQAVAGGTDASVAMAKEAGNKMMGDTIADIAASDQARKTRVDELHRQAEAQFAQQDINREINRANNIKEAAQGASNAIFSAAGALAEGATSASKVPNLAGASNNSKVVTSPKVADNAITQAATGSGERYNAELKDWDNPEPTITDAENEHFRRAAGA